MTTLPLQELEKTFLAQQSRIMALEERLANRTIQLEDIGWTRLDGRNPDEDTGLDLDALHTLSDKLRDMAAADPLHKRGAQLRHAYVFGRGINFSGLNPRTEAAIKDRHNKSVLFSVQAYETNNLAKFTDGNLFIIRNEKTNDLTSVPLSQITADITDPDDPSRVRYFKREWSTGDGEARKVWYPVARYKKSQVGRGRRGSIPTSIKNGSETVPVAQEAVIYHETTQRQSGWTYGVPDSLAAAVWAVAYKEYLADNATLVKALQQFAWAVTNANKATQNQAAVQVATNPGVGGTAVMGSGNALGSVGVPSANVNFNNGQPLAAMVATSFGVPVIALLSSPGATGGSYGAATTLDTPTIKGMKAVQDSWKLFYEEILEDMGSPDAIVTFPNITEDENYRTNQAIGIAYADGRLHQDEARAATLELLDVQPLHDSPPKPDAFNAGSDPNDDSNPEPSQGNAGAVPGGVDQNETNHDNDPE